MTEVKDIKNITEFYKRADLNHEDLKAWLAENPEVGRQVKQKQQEAMAEMQKSYNYMEKFINEIDGMNPMPKIPPSPEMEAAAQTPGLKTMERLREEIASMKKDIENYNPEDDTLQAYVWQVTELSPSQIVEITDSKAVNLLKTKLRMMTACGAGGLKLIKIKASTVIYEATPLPSRPPSDPLSTKDDARKTAALPTFYGIVADGIKSPIVGDLIGITFPDKMQLRLGIWEKVVSHMGVVERPLSPKSSFKGSSGSVGR